MLLARYIAEHFFKAAGIALAVLLSLFSFLALAEALESVGEGSFTTADAISVVLLTTPARFLDLLPVTTLLGSVLGLGLLANHHELTAMRAAGLSAARLARTLAAIAAALVAVAIALQFVVIPAAERKAQEFRARTLEQTARGGAEFWSRHDQRVIRVGEVAFGRIPRDIEIYEMGPANHLVHVLLAVRADIESAHRWLLHDVEERVIDGDTVSGRHLESLPWPSFLSPDQISTLVSPAHALSPIDLYRYLRETAGSGLDTREHQVRFWHQVSLPLTLFGMTLLGLPLVAGAVRARSTGLRTIIGGAIGIAFYLFERITGQLALLLDLDPAFTALVPALLVMTAALLGIRRLR
ncbi:MAG: LPS export ABC transporter permease LptG [Gammaproteobacteria bacterium]|nr:LPS export ABC transporter permease LptG [Gammaproteobacteria bacterium]